MTSAALAVRRSRAVAALGLSALLTGCTPADGVQDLEAVFDEEQQADDVLSDAQLEDITVDGDTTRRLAEESGTTYYAARTEDGASTCLVLAPAEGDTIAGCTMTPNPTGTEVSNGEDTAMFVVPGTDFTSLERSGWTRLGDFLAVR
ncbi:hypothetical protein ACFQHV_22780 [Promicromonospora thailandica]|uniref:Secreted protein n=1 Tax=Promicromonospora thailandica TaxID=765201 RepID=A0A9X2FY64_9MICO|nr:hypothetical protein [Promicromonospora thailandica]MCP2263452.1 hypothetical protein [Promicromonospora thailandica]BFF19378.1 hypothetical protein GCM10025730_28990 [Promicromonospora thailandica]